MDNERKRALNNSVSLCPIWPTQASEKIGHMLTEISHANVIIDKIAGTAQNSAIKGGFAAETWHAESFNLDAILKDKDVRPSPITLPIPRSPRTIQPMTSS